MPAVAEEVAVRAVTEERLDPLKIFNFNAPAGFALSALIFEY